MESDAPYKELRPFLKALEKEGELKRVKKNVSPKYELAAICRKLIAEEGPAVLFEKVEGSPIPVLANLLATRKRIAMALGTELPQLRKVWQERTPGFVEPRLISAGPCQEVVKEDFNLMEFPVPILWNEGDGGPYITFALFVCKDPRTGKRNVGIYRIHLKAGKKAGANIQTPQHAGICQQIAEAQGKPLECALVIGAEPACYIAALAPLDFGEDELSLAGALRQGPVELVKCKTVDLEVPANAEIVLEGKVPPNVREVEGPFGEWTGYVSGAAPKPVIEFTCLTHRQEPLYMTTYEGYPAAGTSTCMQGVAREPVWFKRIQQFTCPTIKDITFTDGGVAGLHVVVSIKKQAEGQGKNVILDLLRSASIKHVVVVDDDINVHDLKMVEWAIATRVQADKDVIIIPGMAAMRLDPSQPAFPSGLGAKMGIDATRPLGKEFPPLVKVPDDVMKKVESQWEEYGL